MPIGLNIEAWTFEEEEQLFESGTAPEGYDNLIDHYFETYEQIPGCYKRKTYPI